MRCAWRELASYVDVWWVPSFVGWCLVILIASVVGFAFKDRMPWPPWMKREYWWQRNLNWITLAEKRRLDQWLRDTGWGWTIIVRRLVVAWFLLLAAWPLISPTFCENVKCRGARGLMPRTECLPQNGSRRDAVRSSGSDAISLPTLELRCQTGRV
jgi:hypothetical protein